jgi:hypothetical protein
MSELLAILLTGTIGMGVSYGLMLLFKIKPGKETSADAWIEGYMIGQQMDDLFNDD